MIPPQACRLRTVGTCHSKARSRNGPTNELLVYIKALKTWILLSEGASFSYLLHCVLWEPIVVIESLKYSLANFSLLRTWRTSEFIKAYIEPLVDFVMDCMVSKWIKREIFLRKASRLTTKTRIMERISTLFTNYTQFYMLALDDITNWTDENVSVIQEIISSLLYLSFKPINYEQKVCIT